MSFQNLRSFIQDTVLKFRAGQTAYFQNQWKHGWKVAPEELLQIDTEMLLVWQEKELRIPHLGAGHFSFVLPHPTDITKVIKIFPKGADASFKYLEVCVERNFSKSWMPIVHELGTCLGVPYAIMERLAKHSMGYDTSYQTCKELEYHFYSEFGFDPNDVHSGNFMIRHRLDSDGCPVQEIVLTDPTTYWE